jgi:hypothetical protein
MADCKNVIVVGDIGGTHSRDYCCGCCLRIGVRIVGIGRSSTLCALLLSLRLLGGLLLSLFGLFSLLGFLWLLGVFLFCVDFLFCIDFLFLCGFSLNY